MIGRDLIEDQVLREILQSEFLLFLEEEGERELLHARAALFVYDDLEDFLNQTGWERDNPEAADENYLTKNRICRWVNGRFFYFSAFIWEGKWDEVD